MNFSILIITGSDTFATLSSLAFCRDQVDVFFAKTSDEAKNIFEKQKVDVCLVTTEIEKESSGSLLESMKEADESTIVILCVDEEASQGYDPLRRGYFAIINTHTTSDELYEKVVETLNVNQQRIENIRFKTLLPLYQLAQSFIKAENEEEIYTQLIDIISRFMQASSISVMMFDQVDSLLKIVASVGIEQNIVDEICLNPGEKIAGWVYEKGQPIVLTKDNQQDSPVAGMLKRDDIYSSISFPLQYEEQIFGVINISQNKKNIFFQQSDLDLLTIICNQAVVALEKIRSMKELEKNVLLKTLFKQYVSEEVAELLVNKEEKLTEIGGVKDLTILFADIRNFTSLVQNVMPDKLRIFLNSFFDLIADEVFKQHGTLDKFMGDAALAFFGSPVEVEKPCVAAVITAENMLKGFEKLKSKWAEKFPAFNKTGLGIGISRGDVFLGNVGSERRFDYTVIGTDVNIAQRLASDAMSSQILLTQNVYADINAECKKRCKKVPSKVLRGVESEIPLYSLIY